MFFGTHERNMDDKGRVVIPTEWRAELGGEFMGYAAEDPCVELVPASGWTVLEQRVGDRDPFDRRTRRLERIYFGGAHKCSVDEAGRTVIPPALRKEAKLGKDVVFVGTRSRIELWDADLWRKTRAELLAEEE